MLAAVVKPSKLRFAAALLVAAAFSDVTSAEGWRRIWTAICLWLGLLGDAPYVDAQTAAKRLAVCRACPVFYPRLQTCGSPLRYDPEALAVFGVWRADRSGCWCEMTRKAPLAAATCWLDDELGEESTGWREHLERKMPI